MLALLDNQIIPATGEPFSEKVLGKPGWNYMNASNPNPRYSFALKGSIVS